MLANGLLINIVCGTECREFKSIQYNNSSGAYYHYHDGHVLKESATKLIKYVLYAISIIIKSIIYS